LISQSARFTSAAALVALSLSALAAAAQQQVPPAPSQAPAASTQVPTVPPAGELSAPAPKTAPTFPKPDPANFTATSPSKELVGAFLQATWGYDTDRMWQVQAIMKTPVEGISKVVVFVDDKTGKQKPAAVQFFTLPDGKHVIAGNEIVPFGEHPFATDRALLASRADGPYRGSAAKDLELVEFADFQCPHCKEVQANMDKLAVDFPKAHIVFQTLPLERIHPEAKTAAEYGYCVAKLGGSDAFFTFVGAVFEGQEGLTTRDGATMTLNSAATKAGLDPAKISTCVAEPATGAAVEASVKLADDLNIVQTPTLMVNGRQVPIGGVPYDILKKVVAFQAKEDGVAE
jgi:protein-disulfide isomerase